MSKETKYVTQTKKEFIEQHKNVIVSFNSYSKYKFYFTAIIGEELEPTGRVVMVYGDGDSTTIYRFDTSPNDSYAVGDMDWDKGTYKDWVTNTEYSFCD
jgi:hypothetical protein